MNQKEWYDKLQEGGATASGSIRPPIVLIENEVVDVHWLDNVDARNKYAKEMRKDGFTVDVKTENSIFGSINSLVAKRSKV